VVEKRVALKHRNDYEMLGEVLEKTFLLVDSNYVVD
jgi:hypothetical protein